MKAVFDYAVAADLILGNPASHLKRRRITQAEISAPSSSATKQLPGLFQKADALLKDQLDNLMASYATSEPTFHGEYGAARVIVDAGGGAAKAPPAPAPAPAA